MHPLLKKYLEKLGIKDYFDMNSEEKKAFKELEENLSGRRLTDDDVKSYLETEHHAAVLKLVEEPDKHTQRNRDFFACEVRILGKLLRFLDSPQVVKANTERELEEKVK